MISVCFYILSNVNNNKILNILTNTYYVILFVEQTNFKNW